MSPQVFANPAGDTVAAAVRRLWIRLGIDVRQARLARGWTVATLAERAGVSKSIVYLIERGEPTSPEAAVRVTSALGLRLEWNLGDPRRKPEWTRRQKDPVHSAMGELEARHLRRLSFPVGIDEPYQHYQFAGRADVVSWNLERRALLHIENRTQFPDFQDMAGSYSAKRAYLPGALAQRLGIRDWRSVTHVMVALWSSDVLHALRLRPESFRALCPDPPDSFAAWWRGEPPTTGTTSALIVLDPATSGRQRLFIGPDEAVKGARPRHRGYADAAAALLARGRATP